MASELVESADNQVVTTWHRLNTWFDAEIAAVVTILLGLFQLLLSASLIQTDQILSKFFFLLPFVLGMVIVAGGSFTIACKKNPSKLLLRGSACSNALGLVGSLLAFCIYSYTIMAPKKMEPCLNSWHSCPSKMLVDYTWTLTLQLLLYNTAAVVMHSLLSYRAIKTLKTV